MQLRTGFVTRQPLNMRRNVENGLFVMVVLLLGFYHVILLCHYNDTLLIKAQLGRTTLQEKHLMNDGCYWILTQNVDQKLG